MSSASLVGRCRITVPAAERITTTFSRITPVLMELIVCQSLRPAERRVVAITRLREQEMHVPGQRVKNCKVIVWQPLAGPARNSKRSALGHITQLWNKQKRDFALLAAARKSRVNVTQVLGSGEGAGVECPKRN